jgi:hypothetical protein
VASEPKTGNTHAHYPPDGEPLPELRASQCDGYFADRAGFIWIAPGTKRRVTANATAWVRLKSAPDDHGYERVTVKSRRVPVHRLVCSAWNGPWKMGLVARHLNGDKTDNRPENLAWGTYSDNRDDSIRHGTDAAGERHGNAKLCDASVAVIRAVRNKKPITIRMLAKAFGVSPSAISNVMNGLRWNREIEGEDHAG